MAFYPTVITTLGFFAIAVFGGGLVLLVMIASPPTRARLAASFHAQERHPIMWACMLALIATGSLELEPGHPLPL